MATITLNTSVKSSASAVNLTRVTMTASDTLTYQTGSGQVLDLVNTTGSSVTISLAGTAPNASIPVAGYGTVSATGGKSVTVPANGQTFLNLDSISQYLAGTSGTVTITNGTGLIAALYA